MKRKHKATKPLEPVPERPELPQCDNTKQLMEVIGTRMKNQPAAFIHPEIGPAVGSIEEVEYVGEDPKKGIPDFRLHIRGLSGKSVWVNLVHDQVQVHESWDKARRDVERRGA